MLLYNNNQASVGSHTPPIFFDTINIRRKYKDGREEIIRLNAYGKKYLALSGTSQYWLTTWVTVSDRYGLSEATVVAFEYHRMSSDQPKFHLPQST